MQGTGSVTDLGLGTSLADQTKDDTEEERKRRRLMGLGLGSAGMATPQVSQLFGLGGIGGR